MTNATQRYWVRLGSGSLVTCESLGLAPRDLSRASLQPDVLTFTQHRIRGGWAVTLAHDSQVRFYRENEDTTVDLLFHGRVVSPSDFHDARARGRTIRVANAWQFASEVMFHRGAWTPPQYVSGVATGSTNELYTTNGDQVSLFYGAVYTVSGASRVRQLRRQTVTQAVREAIDNLQLLVTREGVTAGWQFDLAGNYFGSNPVSPAWSYEKATNYLEWLIKCVQPVPDAFATWDYSGTRPAVRFGRFRDQTATVVQTTGYPTLAFDFERQLHQEVDGLVVVHLNGLDGLDETIDYPLPGFDARFLTGVYPTSPAPEYLDRKVRTFTLAKQTLGSPTTLLNYLGPSVTQPVVTASLSAAGEPWTWLKPGAVLDFGGVRLNVQVTRFDLATEVVTATMGMPRHLGVEDIESLQRWLTHWTTRRNGAA